MGWTWIINLILTVFFWQFPAPAAVNYNQPIISLKAGAPAVEIAAQRSAVLSAQDNFFFFKQRADETQPIASITKLMTALVFLDNNPGWDNTYTITTADKVEGGHLNLFTGDEVKIKDLFYTSLIASDNGATLALVHSTGLSEPEFIRKMNDRAKKLRLNNTHFSDPVGLSANNISTAREVAFLGKAAWEREEIRQATRQKGYEFKTVDGRKKIIESTDYLLFDPEQNPFQVLGGKTGYTDQAGYCFVGRFRDRSGRELISAVLNSAGKNERFKETKSLVNWVFDNYNWLK